MDRKRRVAIIGGSCFLVFVLLLSLAYAGGTTDCKAVLSGKVSANGLARVGQQVSAGDVLVQIDSFAGLAPTAKSPIDGKVVAVFVQVGGQVSSGDVLVQVEER